MGRPKKVKTEEAAGKGAVAKIDVQELNIKVLKLTIVGDSPLIVNRFNQKVKDQLGDQHTGSTSRVRREARVPEDEFEAAKYKTADGKDGVPAGGLKKAMITACTSTGKKITKTFLRQAIHIEGDILPLYFERCHMRTEDIGRVGPSKTPRPIWRPQYDGWLVDLSIVYNADIITPSHIVNMLDLAGFAVGFCEWRPERDGEFGRFHVSKEADEERVAAIRKHAGRKGVAA